MTRDDERRLAKFVADRAKLERIITICGDRLKTCGDILAYADFFFLPDDEIKHTEPITREDRALLCFWRDCVGSQWTIENLEKETKSVAEFEGVKLGHLVKLIRYAISGKTTGPGLYESLAELGRQAVDSRIGNRIGCPWNPTIRAAVLMSRIIWLSHQIPRIGQKKRFPISMRLPDFSEEPEPDDPQTAYFKAVLARGYGMITCGDYLGIMVAPENAIAGCPRGWCFVPSEVATLDLLRLAYSHLKDGKGGRDKWPKNQKLQPGKKQTQDEMMDTLFDSQDYIG